MRLISAVAIATLLATAAHADTMKNCAAAWKAMTPAQQKVMTHQAWNTKCLAKGYTVPANAAAIPAGATAMCKDNTYTMQKEAKGRCSGHGGVARTL
ncbi:MAG TPA: DUF3761 domain-containing protein [Rhizomicrobium sp.]|jgi:hypothetical protein